MKQLSIKFRDRTYRLTCADEEEARLVELKEHVLEKARQLEGELGRMGDAQLFLMSALLIADELWDARGKTAGRRSPEENVA